MLRSRCMSGLYLVFKVQSYGSFCSGQEIHRSSRMKSAFLCQVDQQFLVMNPAFIIMRRIAEDPQIFEC